MSSERNGPRPDFDRHRKNHRTMNSICLHCCAIVATASSEAELAEKEAQHLCWKKKRKSMRQHHAKNDEAA